MISSCQEIPRKHKELNSLPGVHIVSLLLDRSSQRRIRTRVVGNSSGRADEGKGPSAGEGRSIGRQHSTKVSVKTNLGKLQRQPTKETLPTTKKKAIHTPIMSLGPRESGAHLQQNPHFNTHAFTFPHSKKYAAVSLCKRGGREVKVTVSGQNFSANRNFPPNLIKNSHFYAMKKQPSKLQK